MDRPVTDSLLAPGGSTWAWRRRRAEVLDRDGATCQLRLLCAGAPANTVDHIVPRSLWPAGVPGLDDPGNLQAACAPCNRSKAAGGTLRTWTW